MLHKCKGKWGGRTAPGERGGKNTTREFSPQQTGSLIVTSKRTNKTKTNGGSGERGGGRGDITESQVQFRQEENKNLGRLTTRCS